MFNLDPKAVAAVQEITKNIKGVIVADYATSTITVTFSGNSKDAEKGIIQLLDSLPKGLAQQLATFFAIKGEIIVRNR